MPWADPYYDFLLDEVPTCTGEDLAKALCPDLSDEVRKQAVEALSNPELPRTKLRKLLSADGHFEVEPEALEAFVDRVLAGEEVRLVAEEVRQGREGPWWYVDWDYVAQRYAMAADHPEMVVVVEAGQVSDVLQWDKETTDEGWPLAAEYVWQELPRVALADGKEAVMLPPKVEGVRLYHPEPVEDGLFGRGEVPSGSYLELAGLTPEQVAAVEDLKIAVLAERANRVRKTARPGKDPNGRHR